MLYAQPQVSHSSGDLWKRTRSFQFGAIVSSCLALNSIATACHSFMSWDCSHMHLIIRPAEEYPIATIASPCCHCWLQALLVLQKDGVDKQRKEANVFAVSVLWR